MSAGHPWDGKEVSTTGAGRLQEWKNKEFVRELRKKGFVKVAVNRDVIRLRECPLAEIPLYNCL